MAAPTTTGTATATATASGVLVADPEAEAGLTLEAGAPPWSCARLDAGDGHALHVRVRGDATRPTALVLHGGPGSGTSALLTSFFAPDDWRVIAFDQRGAGRSRPAGATAANTTAHLLADVRRLRAALGVGRWLVVGGSWGATLALAHAIDAPDAVAGLLLRATFLARPADIAGFFDDAPAALRDGWPRLADDQAHGALDDAAGKLASLWWAHERRRAASAGQEALESGAAEANAARALPAVATRPATDALLQRYRVQAHYLRADCWIDPPLLERAAALPAVPTLLLHGTADRVCPPGGAAALAARLPHAALRWIDGAGHDPSHPAMAAAMREALASFAAHGDFRAAAARDGPDGAGAVPPDPAPAGSAPTGVVPSGGAR